MLWSIGVKVNILLKAIIKTIFALSYNPSISPDRVGCLQVASQTPPGGTVAAFVGVKFDAFITHHLKFIGSVYALLHNAKCKATLQKYTFGLLSDA